MRRAARAVAIVVVALASTACPPPSSTGGPGGGEVPFVGSDAGPAWVELVAHTAEAGATVEVEALDDGAVEPLAAGPDWRFRVDPNRRYRVVVGNGVVVQRTFHVRSPNWLGPYDLGAVP